MYIRHCQPSRPRLSSVLQDRGLTSTDLPKAIVFHEVLGAAMAIGFWSVSFLRVVGHDCQAFCSIVTLVQVVDKMLCSKYTIVLDSPGVLWSDSHAPFQACYTVQPSRTVFRPLAQRASDSAVARKSYDAAVQTAQRTMTRLPWLQKVRTPGASNHLGHDMFAG
jgi:hypothetical protein